jgi:hypothetical protein
MHFPKVKIGNQHHYRNLLNVNGDYVTSCQYRLHSKQQLNNRYHHFRMSSQADFHFEGCKGPSLSIDGWG